MDAAFAGAGGVVSPFYDSLIVKLISHAGTFQSSVQKMLRALREFRIRGVKVNLDPFFSITTELFAVGVILLLYFSARPMSASLRMSSRMRNS